MSAAMYELVNDTTYLPTIGHSLALCALPVNLVTSSLCLLRQSGLMFLKYEVLC